MDNTKEQKVGASDFENRINELQKIVSRLENDPAVTLEDSMTLYESGLKIAKECVDDLAAMQARIAELNGQLDIILHRPIFGAGNED